MGDEKAKTQPAVGQLPKGKAFSRRFLFSLIGLFALFLVIIAACIEKWGPNGRHGSDQQVTSSAASGEAIDAIAHQREPILLMHDWSVIIDGKAYPVTMQNGVPTIDYQKQPIPLTDGTVVYKNGKAYQYEHGKLVPLTSAQPRVGDIVMKDGKLYQVGQDGKLHPYNGKLKPGQVVWKNGKPYVVGQDGKLHTISDHPQVGDIVMGKDGKLYQVGQDGKLHAYNGKLKPGQVVWKNGKSYVVGQDGQLHALPHDAAITAPTPATPAGAKPGQLVEANGKLYQVGEDGKLHPYSGDVHPGQVIWKDGKAYVIGQDGKPVPLADAQRRGASASSDQVAAQHKAAEDVLKQAEQSQLVVLRHADSKKTSTTGASDAADAARMNRENQLLAAQSHGDAYNAQNDQASKTAFLKASTKTGDDQLSSHLQHPTSPYMIDAGWLIPATLVTGIDSDLPGEIIAQVSENVFDTVSGNYLLIPQGTRLIGSYSSQVAYGQKRVLIAWSRLVYPNGTSFDLSGMPGADLQGYAGLTDQVDNHYARVFGSALMFSIFGALGQLSQPNDSNSTNGYSNQQVIYSAIGQQLTQTAAQKIAKDMIIQPTIKIRPGDNFNVLVTRDMVLPGPYQFSGGMKG